MIRKLVVYPNPGHSPPMADEVMVWGCPSAERHNSDRRLVDAPSVASIPIRSEDTELFVSYTTTVIGREQIVKIFLHRRQIILIDRVTDYTPLGNALPLSELLDIVTCTKSMADDMV